MPSTTTPQNTDGPCLSFDTAAPYVQYGHIDTLHALQQPRTTHPSERDFILTTQIMELLFHTIIHRWEHARTALENDDPRTALTWLKRATHAQDVLVESWQLLADLKPTEFAQFRDHLGPASGFQSYTYRHMEFLLGNKSTAVLTTHTATPHIHHQLHQALHQPSLYDAALRLLARRGLPVPSHATQRDWSQPHQPDPQVEQAWIQVYRGHDPEALDLAETLLDTAERHTRWRHRHLHAVKRVLGAKPGTGGSSGLHWLEQAAQQDVFTELWSLRSTL
ncbi:tryptophan 2,3-dioxygenase family protein [Lipingzhangella sp. LS1_29]|uniref:Tryptophan 2,3-dioxygenase n=1 Tax=Lipingzhangella rawalii TaxID=2055835 RepID=A0ABU2H1F3_9ACTN|nr:tryptophan 2,3-dioxygenase family protein [Lipingzhangella rawalii]MDS1269137.1 tryptophan 2,3-dioxygenase family protein [Lipingzhangella rawalii]